MHDKNLPLIKVPTEAVAGRCVPLHHGAPKFESWHLHKQHFQREILLNNPHRADLHLQISFEPLQEEQKWNEKPALTPELCVPTTAGLKQGVVSASKLLRYRCCFRHLETDGKFLGSSAGKHTLPATILPCLGGLGAPSRFTVKRWKNKLWRNAESPKNQEKHSLKSYLRLELINEDRICWWQEV